MSGKIDNLIGRRFGRLLVLEFIGVSNRNAEWLCICDCGNKKIAKGCYLKARTTSCGCRKKEILRSQQIKGKVNPLSIKHGHSARAGMKPSKTYNSWRAMIERCTYPKNKHYYYYGGRGITVCNRWLGDNGFINFLNDMGERPTDMTLDRVDPNFNYEPSNCRWADAETQANNKRR